MDHLKYLGVEWIRSMFIDDFIASHSDNIIDVAAMAMTIKYNATHGTGMVIQVGARTDDSNPPFTLCPCPPA